MNPCACGCGRLVVRLWSQGHNRRGVPPTNKRGWTVSNGYRYLWMPEHPQAHPNGYMPEHRVVMERVLGRYLRADEVVHHKNGNRADNAKSNLDVLTKQEHDRLHTLVSETCLNCGGPHRARGLCAQCYGRFTRAGRQMPLLPTRRSRWNCEATAN